MRKKNLYAGVILLLAGLMAIPWSPALAKEKEKKTEKKADIDKGRIYAVQKKLYSLKHELNLGGAVLPMDALYKGFAVGGGYTYHFSHHWAWEVIQAAYSFDIDTGLKKKLKENYNLTPPAFRVLNGLASSNLVFVPLYGKMAWMNRKVIQLECALTLGPGMSQYTDYVYSGTGDNYQEKKNYYFSINYGLGFRVFVNKSWSVRLDMRDYMTFIDGGIDNVAYFGLSLAWNFHLPKFSEYEEKEE